MDDTQRILRDNVPGEGVFGDNVENAIISLAFDHPELITSVAHFLEPKLFKSVAAQYVMAILLNYLDEFDIIPTRGVIRDRVLNELTSDCNYEPVLNLIDRKSDPRETPVVKKEMISWAKKKSFGLLYDAEGLAAYNAEDWDKLQDIMDKANRINDFQATGIWLLDNYQLLFDEKIIEHRTTGFPKLDAILNNGGPSPKEVVCWLAGTNVGKSILMCNNAITSWKGQGSGGRMGQDVLLVTFELDYIKTAMRCLGVMSKDIPINTLIDHQSDVINRVNSLKSNYDGKIFVAELPPEECSVSHIENLVDSLRKQHGWQPNVVVIDYMDLMVSKRAAYNNDDYTRQKYVANEIRALAKKLNVLVFTATQVNRTTENNKGKSIDLNRAAESYAKQFSMDYVISINQSDEERVRVPAIFRLFVAKNRNGPRNETVTCEINYNTMLVKEINS